MKIDIIGDIHGCYEEFVALTKKMEYDWTTGIPMHADGRLLGFVGDLTDRGPSSLRTVAIVANLVKQKRALYVPGNHCNKLYRYFLGRNVSQTHGLETTVAEYLALPNRKQKQIRHQFMELYENNPLYQVVDDGKLIIAHAGIREDMIGRFDKRVQTFVLYGDITGNTDAQGFPERRNWAKHHRSESVIVYGHTPVREPHIQNRTYNIDTGCVFGGHLTAIRYPELQIVSVPSTMPEVPEKFRIIKD